MSKLTHYVFKSVWHVPAPKADVMKVLADLPSYAEWWPEIREVRPLGPVGRFEVVARSFLPYSLRFVSDGDAPAEGASTVDARLTGDLEGTVRWTVTEEDGGCQLVYDQEVDTHKRLLNVLAPVARPGFKFNHTLMMRHGEAGLRSYLATHKAG